MMMPMALGSLLDILLQLSERALRARKIA